MRIALTLAAAGLVCAAQSQTPQPEAEARRLLNSITFRKKVWGAWYAGASQDVSLRPRLIDELKRAQSLRESPLDSEAYAYVQALFDALIQIPGPVPGDVILPFADSWRTEVLILLGRDRSLPDLADELFAMRSPALPDEEFVAVNDLLFRAAPKLAYEAALKEMRVTHDFVVTDQVVAFCGGSTACGLSNRGFPKDFPPIALYQLRALMNEPGDVLLFDEPIPVFYRKTVAPTNSEAEWSDCAFDPAADLRQRRVNRFVAGVDSLTERESEELFSPRTIIHWNDAAQTVAEMEKSLDEQSASLRNLFSHLERRALAQVSGMRIRIETTIENVRRDRSEKPPAVASREILYSLRSILNRYLFRVIHDDDRDFAFARFHLQAELLTKSSRG